MRNQRNPYTRIGGLKLSEKRCTKCGRLLSLSEFYPHAKHAGGVGSACKACTKSYNREHHLQIKDVPGFKEHVRDYNHEWHERNRERNNERVSQNHRNERQICIEAYGGKCACCGESRYEFLCIDHMNGNGNKHRQQVGNKICRWLIAQNFPTGFRVLCHNCNQALGHYGFCPHEKDRGLETA